ncbi:transposase-like protein [Clostridium moniliforme]|uniref:Transposase-like protein n=1 Tax=Clostridium moniliforme TaxID=39489 RepID=A0ABS4F2C2_9CLOT|nr:hypothetical protein [Clostridium moniliforme]MBP1890382.1 transposase-like protein [Clostridium moniliforme]
MISIEKKKKIIEKFKNNDNKNISKVARHFNVSRSFAWKLLKENKLI